MSIEKELTTYQDEIRVAVEQAIEAEHNDDPLVDNQNSDRQKTHFEFKVGSGSEEVAIYIERYNPGKGIEILVFADESYFQQDEVPTYLLGAGEPLETVDELLCTIVEDVVGTRPQSLSFHQPAPPSVVYSTVAYLD